MKLKFWKRQVIVTGGGSQEVRVAMPAKPRAIRRVRRFLGTYECGCDVDLHELQRLASEGKPVHEVMRCDKHMAPLAYGDWSEPEEMSIQEA